MSVAMSVSRIQESGISQSMQSNGDESLLAPISVQNSLTDPNILKQSNSSARAASEQVTRAGL